MKWGFLGGEHGRARFEFILITEISYNPTVIFHLSLIASSKVRGVLGLGVRV